MNSHAIFLNSSFNESKVYFDDDISTLTVQWFLNVYVNSSSGNPVRDVNIEIYNISDDLIAVGITDKNGFLKYIPVTERIQNSTMNTTFSPYNVTAIKGGYITYANPEPIVNNSKQVNLTFFVTPSSLHHITIIPKGPETFVIGEDITYIAEGWNDVDEIQLNTTWTPIWSVDNITLAVINNVTGLFTALDIGNGMVNVTSTEITNIYNTSAFTITLPPLHHIVITPLGPYNYYIGEIVIYTAVGWNDAAETMLNLSWNPVWSIDDSSIAMIDPSSGEFTSLSLGSSNVRVSDLFQVSVFNVSAFSVIPWPLHHISINPSGPTLYNIEDNQIYTAIGWNDAAETQQNFTWIPVWSVNNTFVASIDSVTGEFNAIAQGHGIVNVTDLSSQLVYSISVFIILPYPLHHIDIIPEESMRYQIGDEIIYSAIGWNDENESYQNTTWIPQWNVTNSSIATIDPVTGEFLALALGSGEINVSAVGEPGIYKMIQFTIEPWPLHHIVITPTSPETYYIGDTQTYTTIGWNDANETQMNASWTPVWSIDDSTIASIDSSSGDFTALVLGSSNVVVSAASLPQISNTSSFTVDPWPLHHIEIVPGTSGNYYIGDNNTYVAIGWNDEAETQENITWIPVWNIENTSLATIDESGNFTANAMGNSVINVSSSSNPLIFSNYSFTIHPWPLHHIQLYPSGPQAFAIGDIYSYTVVGWNDALKTQINTTWTPVWSLEGDLDEFTWEGEEARFEFIKSGEGILTCEDEATGFSVSSEIVVRKEPQGADSTWVWILTAIILIVFILMMFLIFIKIKKDKNISE